MKRWFQALGLAVLCLASMQVILQWFYTVWTSTNISVWLSIASLTLAFWITLRRENGHQ